MRGGGERETKTLSAAVVWYGVVRYQNGENKIGEGELEWRWNERWREREGETDKTPSAAVIWFSDS